jgi:hypothetical protein
MRAIPPLLNAILCPHCDMAGRCRCGVETLAGQQGDIEARSTGSRNVVNISIPRGRTLKYKTLGDVTMTSATLPAAAAGYVHRLPKHALFSVFERQLLAITGSRLGSQQLQLLDPGLAAQTPRHSIRSLTYIHYLPLFSQPRRSSTLSALERQEDMEKRHVRARRLRGLRSHSVRGCLGGWR